jgi:hypothetical protein
MYIVLETQGKNETVAFARVHIFDTRIKAEVFIDQTNTGKYTYWRKAELVSNGEEVELKQPEE